MAEKALTTYRPVSSVHNTVIAQWATLVTGDTSEPWAGGDYTDKSVHVFNSDFTGGGSVSVQGSNDPRVITDPANADWVILKNDAGAACTYSADDKFDVIVAPMYFTRILVTGTVAGVNVAMCGRRIK